MQSIDPSNGAWPGLALILSSTIATAGELCNYNTHINKQFAAEEISAWGYLRGFPGSENYAFVVLRQQGAHDGYV